MSSKADKKKVMQCPSCYEEVVLEGKKQRQECEHCGWKFKR
jgi:ribosomal protein S27AE